MSGLSVTAEPEYAKIKGKVHKVCAVCALKDSLVTVIVPPVQKMHPEVKHRLRKHKEQSLQGQYQQEEQIQNQ